MKRFVRPWREKSYNKRGVRYGTINKSVHMSMDKVLFDQIEQYAKRSKQSFSAAARELIEWGFASKEEGVDSGFDHAFRIAKNARCGITADMSPASAARNMQATILRHLMESKNA